MKSLTAVILALASSLPAFADPRSDAVDKLFERFARSDSPGCAVGVSLGGQVVYKHAYGMADLERSVPLTPRSVFNVGSIAKQFTAASILLLAQRGAVALADPVRKYVPELPTYYDRVTIDQLMHHTSGMVDVASLMILIHDGLGREHISDLEAEGRDGLGDFHMSEDEFLQLMSRQRSLEFEPGDRFAYTNSGYILLATVLRRVSGKPLPQFAQEQIFGPLGMTSTKFVDDHAELVKSRAIGYLARRGATGFLIDSGVNDLIGDGGLFTTVEDLIRWNRNFDTGEVGGKELLKAMLTPGTLKDGTVLEYAAGLVVGAYRGVPMVSHAGADHAYWNDVLRLPEQRFVVACACNTFTDAESLTRRIADIYFGHALKDDAAAAPGGASRRPKIIDLEGVDLGAYAGDYTSEELQVTFRFVVENDQLRLAGRKSNDPVAYPIGVDRFFFKPGMELTFKKDADERVIGFTLAVRATNWSDQAFAGLSFTRVGQEGPGAPLHGSGRR